MKNYIILLKKKVKAKFQKTSRWPSAYGSGFLVKEYKKAFKDKYGNKSPYKTQKNQIKKSKNRINLLKNHVNLLKNRVNQIKII